MFYINYWELLVRMDVVCGSIIKNAKVVIVESIHFHFLAKDSPPGAASSIVP